MAHFADDIRDQPVAEVGHPARRGAPRVLRDPYGFVTGRAWPARWSVASLPSLVLALVVQIGGIFLILQAYSLLRKSFWQRSPDVAFDHALQIIDAQRWLGLPVTRVELELQRFALERGWLIDLFNGYYRQMKLALFLAAVLALVFAPGGFRRVRRMFLLATLLAFPWYALYPLAPPRFMGDYGYPFVDTLAVVGGTVSSSGGLGGANQYAAMPSMHMGWSVVAAGWLAVAIPWRRAGAILGVAHVTMMGAAVMATGNHFWLDIVGGFGIVVAAVVIDRTPRGWFPGDRVNRVVMSEERLDGRDANCGPARAV